MKCDEAGCRNQAVLHILGVRGRRFSVENHYCSEHAERHEPFSKGPRSTSTRIRPLFGDTTNLEIEHVVFFDEHEKVGIYLNEVGGTRRFALNCGFHEGMVLYDLLKNPPPDRPFTHQIMVSAIQALGGAIHEVVIDAYIDGVFHAKLRIYRNDDLIVIDVRPTDAFALAIICDTPITVAENLLEGFGLPDQ